MSEQQKVFNMPSKVGQVNVTLAAHVIKRLDAEVESRRAAGKKTSRSHVVKLALLAYKRPPIKRAKKKGTPFKSVPAGRYVMEIEHSAIVTNDDAAGLELFCVVIGGDCDGMPVRCIASMPDDLGKLMKAFIWIDIIQDSKELHNLPFEASVNAAGEIMFDMPIAYAPHQDIEVVPWWKFWA